MISINLFKLIANLAYFGYKLTVSSEPPCREPSSADSKVFERFVCAYRFSVAFETRFPAVPSPYITRLLSCLRIAECTIIKHDLNRLMISNSDDDVTKLDVPVG